MLVMGFGDMRYFLSDELRGSWPFVWGRCQGGHSRLSRKVIHISASRTRSGTGPDELPRRHCGGVQRPGGALNGGTSGSHPGADRWWAQSIPQSRLQGGIPAWAQFAIHVFVSLSVIEVAHPQTICARWKRLNRGWWEYRMRGILCQRGLQGQNLTKVRRL